MERELTLRSAAEVRPESPRWLWAKRIPLGAVSLLAGREGLGKSTVLVEISSRLTRGELGGDLEGEPANVVIASAEDSPASTLLPRLIAAGADLDRVSLLDVIVQETTGAVPGALTLPDDASALGDLCRSAQARLLVLDPLVSYLPGEVNAHRDQHVRRVLAPLARLANDLALAIVPVVHLNKGETTDVLARVGGSVGLTAAARSVLIVGRDHEDPDGESGSLRVLAHAKCNVGPHAPSLLARIEPRVIDGDQGAIETSRVLLLGESEQTARDLLAQPPSGDDRTARDEAVNFLRAELADGPVATKTVLTDAKDAGIAERTLERAKKVAGVRSRRTADGPWVMELASTEHHGGVGGVGGLPLKTPSGGLQKTATKDAKDAKDAGLADATDLPLASDAELMEAERLQAKWGGADRSDNGAGKPIPVKEVLKLGIPGLKWREQLERFQDPKTAAKRGLSLFPEPDEFDQYGWPHWRPSRVWRWARENGVIE